MRMAGSHTLLWTCNTHLFMSNRYLDINVYLVSRIAIVSTEKYWAGGGSSNSNNLNCFNNASRLRIAPNIIYLLIHSPEESSRMWPPVLAARACSRSSPSPSYLWTMTWFLAELCSGSVGEGSSVAGSRDSGDLGTVARHRLASNRFPSPSHYSQPLNYHQREYTFLSTWYARWQREEDKTWW